MEKIYIPLYSSFDFKKDLILDENLREIIQKRRALYKDEDLKEDAFDTSRESKDDDEYSHFILRVLACSPELRKMFLENETLLFKNRLKKILRATEYSQQHDILMDLLSRQNKEFGSGSCLFEDVNTLPKEERDYFNALFRLNPTRYIVAKVPIQFTTQLLSKRKIIVRQGCSFIGDKDWAVLTTSIFEKCLEKQLNTFVPIYEELMRENKIFFSQVEAVLQQRNQKESFVRILDIEDWPQHYPPCMQDMHQGFQKFQLKNTGRVQYVYYLKSLGMRERELSGYLIKTLGAGPQEKDMNNRRSEYVSLVKHAYEKDMSSYGCKKMVDDPPGNEQTHGCPLSYLSEESLVRYLRMHGIIESRINEILTTRASQNLSDIKNCCQLYFEAKHGAKMRDLEKLSPVLYFQESQHIEFNALKSASNI